MRLNRPKGGEQREIEKPDLRAVLEHYGIYVHGEKGMTRCWFQEQDRKPSMSVDFRTGLYHCHACDKGGDAWTLIMEKEGVDFVGAVEWATRTNLAAAEEVAGGSEQYVPRFSHAGKRGVAQGSRSGKAGGSWRPSWSRS